MRHFCFILGILFISVAFVYGDVLTLKNGQKHAGQLILVTETTVIFEHRSHKYTLTHNSTFPVDSVEKVADESGVVLFKNGIQQVISLRKYYYETSPFIASYSQHSQMPYIISPGYLSVSIAPAITFHSLDKYEDILNILYASEFNQSISGLRASHFPKNTFGIQLSLAAHISHHFHVVLTAHQHFLKRDTYPDDSEEHNYLRLTSLEFKYLHGNRRFQPWISMGYANTAVYLKDYQYYSLPNSSGILKGISWRTHESALSFGIGVRKYIAPKTGFFLTFRYFAFPSKKILGIEPAHTSQTSETVIADKMNLKMFTVSIGFFGNI
ncbi:MAG: hypothetical protein R3C26_17330 [Calditrichia bacterium]